MSGPLFSVVIPAYNSHAFLPRALESLQHQGTSLEVIVIDDGSTDDTCVIAKQYADDFAAFQIISHKKNKGMLEARKTGVAHASGLYTLFLDSDDEITPGFLPQLQAFISDKHEPEIVTFELTVPLKHEEDVASINLAQWFNMHPVVTNCIKIHELYIPIFEESTMSYRLVGRAYKTTWMQEQYADMPSAYVNTSEDAAQTFMLLNSLEAKMAFYDEIGYIYHYGDGSSSDAQMPLSVFKKQIMSSWAALQVLDVYTQNPQKEALSKTTLRFFWFICIKRITRWAATVWQQQLTTSNQYKALKFFQTLPYNLFINADLLRIVRDRAYDAFVHKRHDNFYILLAQLMYLYKHTNVQSAQFMYYCKAAIIHLGDIELTMPAISLEQVMSFAQVKQLKRLNVQVRENELILTPTEENQDREIMPLWIVESKLTREAKAELVRSLARFPTWYFDIFCEGEEKERSSDDYFANARFSNVSNVCSVPYEVYQPITVKHVNDELYIEECMNTYHTVLGV